MLKYSTRMTTGSLVSRLRGPSALVGRIAFRPLAGLPVRFFSGSEPNDEQEPQKPKNSSMASLKQTFYQLRNDLKEFYYKNPKRTYLAGALLLSLGLLFYFRQYLYPELSFHDLLRLIENGEVEIIYLQDFYQKQSNIDGYCFAVIGNRKNRTCVLNHDLLMKTLHNSPKTTKIIYRTKPSFSEVSFYVYKILWIAFISHMLFKVLRARKGSPLLNTELNKIQDFQKSRAKQIVKESNITKRFKDVAGMEEAKLEIAEFVEFLKQPDRFHAMGARLPKGALLSGPPGTGKTLLAKACAGEANVPFFFVSGSEFMEVFVGTGASRVRDLFKQAKESAPAIIFIDEIDAIGRKRSNSMSGSSEADSTLNQLLVEMDGFGTDKHVVVFAATNRKELLDPALLRPGRLDRLIDVTLPDLDGRKDIFKVHLSGLNLGTFDESSLQRFASKLTGSTSFSAQDAEAANKKTTATDPKTSVDQSAHKTAEPNPAKPGSEPTATDREQLIEVHAKRLASLTPGFSGADIANVCNEAAIQAVRSGGLFVSTQHFELAVERVIGGLPRKSLISLKERETIAVHESGHGVVSWFLEGASPLLKLTIIPRAKGSLGFAQYLPNEFSLETEQELKDQIVAILAGRCAEEAFFGRVTTGAYDDLQKAFRKAHAIVARLGMNPAIGLRSLEPNEYGQKLFSEKTNEALDRECKRVIDECTQRCRELVQQHRAKISELSRVLLEKETIDLKIITSVLGQRPFAPKPGFKAYLEHA